MDTRSSTTETELKPLDEDCATQKRRKLTMEERAMMGEMKKARPSPLPESMEKEKEVKKDMESSWLGERLRRLRG